MVYLLKGVPFIYQGQEIGMPAAHYDSIDDFDDVESLGYYRKYKETLSEEECLEKINFGSRDNARHPMAWDGSRNSGFTDENAVPWLRPHNRAAEINVEEELASKKSVLKYYKKMLALRSAHKEFQYGDIEIVSKPEDNFFVYIRRLGRSEWAVVCNFEAQQSIELPFECEAPVLANLNKETASGNYAPFECTVSKVIKTE